MKMPAIVGSFIFISREIFMLSWVEHEKQKHITSGPGLSLQNILNTYLEILYFWLEMFWNEKKKNLLKVETVNEFTLCTSFSLLYFTSSGPNITKCSENTHLVTVYITLIDYGAIGYRPENISIASVKMGILWSISHHIQWLNSQQLFYHIRKTL